MGNYVLEMKNICKSFPGVVALDNVSFNLRRGEVHALLGENGAGKSTLMKIIGGIYEKDSGKMLLEGKEVHFTNTRQASENGIEVIHQELNMCRHLTVAENIFLGRELTRFGFIDERSQNSAAKEIIERFGMDFSPRTVVGNLPVSRQQMVEIAKSTSVNAKIIIMDEPTSSLTQREISELFTIMKQLKSQGKSIIYISHRLEELEEIADRITVLRDGKFIAEKDFEQTGIQEIISLMVGREIKEKYPKINVKKGEKIMSVSNLTSDFVNDVSFDLFSGEIIGFAGLVGAGRTELMRALFGVDRVHGGEINISGKTLKIKNPRSAISAGIVCAPEDRKKEGLILKLSVRENIAIANLDSLSNKIGIMSSKKERNMTEKIIKDLKIKTPSAEQEVNTLSGGNQQKIVVGKWLARNAKVVIFDEPTRGIDVAAKVEIYNLMNELKRKGIGVMFVSSELPEILGMSDRVIVICSGRITGDMPTSAATQDKILRLATKFSK